LFCRHFQIQEYIALAQDIRVPLGQCHDILAAQVVYPPVHSHERLHVLQHPRDGEGDRSRHATCLFGRGACLISSPRGWHPGGSPLDEPAPGLPERLHDDLAHLPLFGEQPLHLVAVEVVPVFLGPCEREDLLRPDMKEVEERLSHRVDALDEDLGLVRERVAAGMEIRVQFFEALSRRGEEVMRDLDEPPALPLGEEDDPELVEVHAPLPPAISAAPRQQR